MIAYEPNQRVYSCSELAMSCSDEAAMSYSDEAVINGSGKTTYV